MDDYYYDYVIAKAKRHDITLTRDDFVFYSFSHGLSGPFIDGMDPLEWLDAMIMDYVVSMALGITP